MIATYSEEDKQCDNGYGAAWVANTALTALREALDHSGEANEMVDCYQEVYDALNAQLIKEPTGNGLDQVAQNNGLVMAMNTLQHLLNKEKNRG